MKKLSLILLFVLLLSSVQVMAQGIVTYGAAVVSTLSAQAPIAIFTFQGTADDQVTIQAIGITPGLDLSISVQSGTEILATADSDPFTSGSTDARVDVRLPATNVYLVLVSTTNGATGDFLFKINGQPAAEKTVITGIPADVPITPGETSYYGFSGSPDAATVLSLTASPDLQFLGVVRDNNGQIVGTSSGTSAIVSVAGEGPYEIALSGVTASMEGIVTVALAEGNLNPAPPQPTTEAPTTAAPTTEAPPPVVTEEVGDTQPDTVNACVVSSGGAVNIRTGPTTNDAILAQMQPGQTYPVIGVNGDWYQINVSGTAGWVFSGVVTTSGDCSAIPTVGTGNNNVPVQATPTVAPTVEQVQPTAPPPPTTDPGNVVQATPTYTPSYTPTTQQQQATATFTPSYTPTTQPAPQIAPEDARFNNPLNIPLDNTTSVLDFVSYPGGDTEDRVRWDITGMNNNSSLPGGKARLVISASCFGEGTENIQFFTGGQTYSCGQTIVDTEVTSASKTGSVVITAVGGNNTYVQWVLTGTATRVN